MTHDDKLAALVGACMTMEKRSALAQATPPQMREEYLSSPIRGFERYLISKSADHDLIDRLWNAYMIQQLTS